MLSSSSAVSPSPAMSVAMASSRRPSRMASAMRGSSSTTRARMPAMLESRLISSAYRKPHTHRQRRPALGDCMLPTQPARTAGRRAPSTLLALVVTPALAGLAGCGSPTGSSSSAPSSSVAQASAGPQERSDGLGQSAAAPPAEVAQDMVPAGPPGGLPGNRLDRVGAEDGVVSSGTTVFDDAYPAV